MISPTPATDSFAGVFGCPACVHLACHPYIDGAFPLLLGSRGLVCFRSPITSTTREDSTHAPSVLIVAPVVLSPSPSTSLFALCSGTTYAALGSPAFEHSVAEGLVPHACVQRREDGLHERLLGVRDLHSGSFFAGGGRRTHTLSPLLYIAFSITQSTYDKAEHMALVQSIARAPTPGRVIPRLRVLGVARPTYLHKGPHETNETPRHTERCVSTSDSLRAHHSTPRRAESPRTCRPGYAPIAICFRYSFLIGWSSCGRFSGVHTGSPTKRRIACHGGVGRDCEAARGELIDRGSATFELMPAGVSGRPDCTQERFQHQKEGVVRAPLWQAAKVRNAACPP